MKYKKGGPSLDGNLSWTESARKEGIEKLVDFDGSQSPPSTDTSRLARSDGGK